MWIGLAQDIAMEFAALIWPDTADLRIVQQSVATHKHVRAAIVRCHCGAELPLNSGPRGDGRLYCSPKCKRKARRQRERAAILSARAA